jgi:alkanesulfonate monooxygenase SsuD/methylene tetrahydromethanopterin reductase-like flavin-dependent oxidoreductase (luciferase family)
MVRPGVLPGTDEEILDKIGQYVDAGGDQLNISLRAPFDMGLLERVSAALHLA